MEEASYLQKSIALALQGQQYIESLVRASSEAVKAYASAYVVIFTCLATAVQAMARQLSSITEISGLSLDRFAYFPLYAHWRRYSAPSKDEPYSSETDLGTIFSPVFFNVGFVRRMSSSPVAKTLTRTPKVTPPAEISGSEKTTEAFSEEPARAATGIPVDLHRLFEYRVAPSLKGVAAAAQVYKEHVSVFAPLFQMRRDLRAPSTQQKEGSPQTVPPRKPLTRNEETAFGKSEETETQPPSHITGFAALKPGVLGAYEYATNFPRQMKKIKATVPGILHAVELAATYETPSLPVSVTKDSVASLIALEHVTSDVASSIASWIYNQSEILRSKALSLSAVPIAASTAQKIMTETLTQPVSSFRSPLSAEIRKSATSIPEAAEAEERMGPDLLETPKMNVASSPYRLFEVPALMISIATAYGQAFAPPPVYWTTRGSGETPFEPAYAGTRATEQAGVPEKRIYPRLPTVIALAAAESLIGQRLRLEFTALASEIQMARPPVVEGLGETGAFRAIRADALHEVAEMASSMLPESESYGSFISKTAPVRTTELSPISPTVQSNLTVVVEAESQEEDLRDLENKINKILSDQMRRYYGSAKI